MEMSHKRKRSHSFLEQSIAKEEKAVRERDRVIQERGQVREGQSQIIGWLQSNRGSHSLDEVCGALPEWASPLKNARSTLQRALKSSERVEWTSDNCLAYRVRDRCERDVESSIG